MVETIPLSQRRLDVIIVAFFLINLLFVSYFIDTEQLVIANPAHFTYPIWPPRPVIDAIHWWGYNFDPLLIARPVFFKVTIWPPLLSISSKIMAEWTKLREKRRRSKTTITSAIWSRISCRANVNLSRNV